MKKLSLILLMAQLAGAMLITTGCSSTGDMRGGTTGTDVQLNQKNYKMVKAGAIGHSYGFRLLGIIPFDAPTAAEAKADLYRSVGQDLTGRAVALANETEDRSCLYLILFSVPKVTYTADVIEFTQENNGAVPTAAGQSEITLPH
jgi:hypothetical protein